MILKHETWDGDENIDDEEMVIDQEALDFCSIDSEEENGWSSSQDTHDTQDTSVSEEEDTPSSNQVVIHNPDDPKTWSKAYVDVLIETDTLDFFDFANRDGTLTEVQQDRIYELDTEKVNKRNEMLLSEFNGCGHDFSGEM